MQWFEMKNFKISLSAQDIIGMSNTYMPIVFFCLINAAAATLTLRFTPYFFLRHKMILVALSRSKCRPNKSYILAVLNLQTGYKTQDLFLYLLLKT